MTYAEKALSYFNNNFNCSQAVFTTFATEMGIDEKTALMVSTNFGGGARCGELCGAVSGALMVLGLRHGHYDFKNAEQKTNAYNIASEFNKRFCEKNGSVVCRKLLGYNLTITEDIEVIKDKNLFKTICPQMVADATEIVEQMLSEIK
jgi:C_GCAxxG_C_C family probable redox protein